MLRLVIFSALSAFCLSQTAEPCDKELCVLPDCRCFSDESIPGGLALEDTPQIVSITGDYTVNSEYKTYYDQVFTDTTINPNGCRITGTFFIQDDGSDYTIVKEYFDKKFEIGINSLNGQIPQDQSEWDQNIKGVRENIVQAGINEIYGVRAPELSPGGTEEFNVFGDNQLLYDSSCKTPPNLASTWPFTYDYDYGLINCISGSSVQVKFPGKWQILIPNLEFNGTQCATPQSCLNVLTKKDAFDILYNNFVTHYDGNRSPYTVVIDAEWFKTDYKREGLLEFVEYVGAAFDDVWVVTQFQALEWVRNPTPIADLPDFEPWKC